MLLTEKLQQTHFPSSQQAVVDFILNNPAAIRDMTIRELAKKTYTSNATMIRIAQKLNYTGWDEFRDDFIREQDYLAMSFTDVDPNIPFTQADTLQAIAAKTAELKMGAIEDTLNLLDTKQVEKAAQILRDASLINVLAVNNTYVLAELFALKMGRIHKLTLASDPRAEIRYNGRLTTPNSCIVAISYTGETDPLLEAVSKAKDAGNKVIALTSIGDNSLARAADVVLCFCTREKMYSKINWYTTEEGIEYLLDLLYSTVFWMDYEQNLKTRVETARSIEYYRSSSGSIISENTQNQTKQ